MKTTNKIRYAQGILSAIVAALALSCMILSCTQPEGAIPAGVAAGKGSIVLSAVTGSGVATGRGAATGSGAGSVQRTIVPSTSPTFSSYTLEFKQGETTLPEIDVELAVLEDFLVEDLDAGTWTVTVTAYSKTGETKYAAASGVATVDVIAGKSEPVEVPVKPLFAQESPNGKFTYQVSFPVNVTGTISLKDGDTEKLVDTGLSASMTGPKSIDLPPGAYKLFISLKNETANTSAGLSEEVHIYSGLDSAGTFSFTAADFAPDVYLAGTIKLSDGVSIGAALPIIKVYPDETYNDTGTVDTTPAAPNPDATGAWILSIPASTLKLSNQFYFKAVVTGNDSKKYIVTGTTGAGLTDKGKQDIELKDTTKPSPVEYLAAEIEADDDEAPYGTVTLTWTLPNPLDEDLDQIEILWSWNSGNGVEEKHLTIAKNSEKYEGDFDGFNFARGTEYTFTVKTVDAAGNAGEASVKASLPYGGTMTADQLADVIDNASETGQEVSIGDLQLAEAVTIDLKKANIKVTSGLTVPANVTLKVGGTLTVDTGATLTVQGNGKLEVLNDANLIVKGNVAVSDNATIIMPATDGTGSITVEGANAKVTLTKGANVLYGASKFIGGEDDYAYNWSSGSGSVTLEAGNVISLADSAGLKAANSTSIPSGSFFVIADGTTLTVDTGKTLTVEGSLDVAGTLTIDGAVKTSGTGLVSVASAAFDSALAALGEDKITRLTLAEDHSLTSNATIPAKVTLTVAAGKTLTVPTGYRLNLDGALDGTGTVKTTDTGYVSVKDVTILASAAKLGADKISNLTLTETVTLSRKTTIPADVTLTIASGKNLAAPNVELNLEGALKGSGTVTTTGSGFVTVSNADALAWVFPKLNATTGIAALKLTTDAALSSSASVPADVTLTIVNGKTLTTTSALTVTGTVTGTVATNGSGHVLVSAIPNLLWALEQSGGTGKITALTLTESATLTNAATVPAGLALTISDSKNLTVSNELKVNGTIAGTGGVIATGADASVTVNNADALAWVVTKLNATTGIKALKLTANAELSSAASVPTGVTLTIDSNKKLTMNSAALTVEGTVAGDVATTNSGSVSVKAAGLAWALEQSGTDKITALTLAENAALTEGTLGSGATLTVADSVTLTINGAFTLDGELGTTGTVTTGPSGSVSVSTAAGLESALKTGIKVLKLTKDGTLTDAAEVPTGATLTVADGATLDLDSKTLTVNGALVVGEDVSKVTFVKATLSDGTLNGTDSLVTLADTKTITLLDTGTITVAGDGSVVLPNSKFGAGVYTANGEVTITAGSSGDTIKTAGTENNGLRLGSATTALGLLAKGSDAATYTLVKGDTDFVVFGNGADAITVGAGAKLEADGKASILLGTGNNLTDAINLGNASTLVLTTGATIGVFTNNPADVADGSGNEGASGSIGGAAVSGSNSDHKLGNSSGTMSGKADTTLTGTEDGNVINAGSEFVAGNVGTD